MKVLVANLGSTSFKYRLFDMATETQLAKGGVERIGAARSKCVVQIGDQKWETELEVPHHGVAVRACLDQLTDPSRGCLKDAREVSAIGFKAVHGGRLQGVFRIDDHVLQSMEEVSSVAPAHNPPYLAAMRQLAATVPEIPLVAAFETDFHSTIPDANKNYAIPAAWRNELPIRKWGFHGASHRYIGWRMATLLQRSDARVISCHLGGSNSLCAIQSGKSVATTMGMSPQSGLPQNNRVGDFDPFALPLIMRHLGKSLEETLGLLANQSGLLGISNGVSGDIRDLENAADAGNADAKLAWMFLWQKFDDTWVVCWSRSVVRMPLSSPVVSVKTAIVSELVSAKICNNSESRSTRPKIAFEMPRNDGSTMVKAVFSFGLYRPTKN